MTNGVRNGVTRVVTNDVSPRVQNQNQNQRFWLLFLGSSESGSDQIQSHRYLGAFGLGDFR